MSEPKKCPVCEGRQTVPAGFYDHKPGGVNITTDPRPEICRTCKGTGMVPPPDNRTLFPTSRGSIALRSSS